MKIAMVTTQYLPVISGVSYYIRQLSESLVKHGHEVTVYTLSNPRLERVEKTNGVLIKRFVAKTKLFRGYEYCPEMAAAIVEDAPDIINSHQYGYYPCAAGIEAAKKLGAPHVLTPVLHPPIFTISRSLLFWTYHNLQGKPAIQQSAAILTLSKKEVFELEKLGADRKKCTVVYNPVMTKLFRPRGGKGWKGKQLVMFVGPLDTPKGADVFFQTAKSILQKRGDVRFLFIGRGIFEAPFKNESAKYPDSFIFTSGIPDKELAQWYARANIIVSPTHYEAFGRALAEAASAGTPAVAARVGAVPEVVLHGKTGYLVDYGKWEELERRVVELLNDKSKAEKFGKNARQHVLKNFREEIFVRKHLEIFEKLVKAKTSQYIKSPRA